MGYFRTMRIIVTFVNGPRAGQQQLIDDRSVIRIGQHADCDLVFDSAEAPHMSAHHAEMREEDGTLVLCDLHSASGTYMGEERVTRMPLAAGAQIRFGKDGPAIAVGYRAPVKQPAEPTPEAPAPAPVPVAEVPSPVAPVASPAPAETPAPAVATPAAATSTPTAAAVSPGESDNAAEVEPTGPSDKPPAPSRLKKVLKYAGGALGGLLVLSMMVGMCNRHRASKILGDMSEATATKEEPTPKQIRAQRLGKIKIDYPPMDPRLTKKEIKRELDKYF